jgi:DNA-binding NarL/FixJ family response regulator
VSIVDEGTIGNGPVYRVMDQLNISPLSPLNGAGPPGKAPSSRTRVMLVDDHPVTRYGLRTLIEADVRFEICAEVDSAPKALEAIGRVPAQVAIVDIGLKSTNGLELTRGLRARSPATEIIIVSMHDEEVYAERALRAGAKGYVMKHEASERIIAALESVLAGRVYLSDRMKDRLLQRFVQQRTEPKLLPVEQISDRELEVLNLIGQGYSTREIANRLKLSIKTIDSYREHLKVRLKLPTGGDLVRYAVQWVRKDGG